MKRAFLVIMTIAAAAPAQQSGRQHCAARLQASLERDGDVLKAVLAV